MYMPRLSVRSVASATDRISDHAGRNYVFALDFEVDMDDLYRDYILEHSRRPHNFGVIEDADASYEGANPLCGDRITLMLGVKDGIVDRVGFTGRGCAISQASASLLTDEIKAKPIGEVAAIRADDLLDLLGIEISPARLKCAMLSHDSLQHVLGDLGAAPPATSEAQRQETAS